MPKNFNTGAVVSKVFDDHVETVKKKSEDLIKNTFPKKIQELNDLLDAPLFDMEAQMKGLLEPLNIPVPDAQAINRALKHSHNNVEEDHEEEAPAGKKRKMNNANSKSTKSNSNHVNHEENNVAVMAAGTRVLALPSGPVPCNVPISKIIEIVKPLIRQLVEYTNMLKMWVTFLIPKIEDGNNFGVSIQEDCLGEIRTVEAEAATFYEQITRYHMNRAKLVSKVAKYPHVEDYRRVVAELDEKEFISMKLVVCELRNQYCSLFDLISKNFEKIIKPRTSNSENLY